MNLKTKHSNQNLLMAYIQTILRGIGQVMLQNNPYTGLLFLVGIFYNSWLLGLAALIATIISTGTAQILKYPKRDIVDGIYGFNGTLVGIAIFYFLGFNLATSIVLILGSVISTPVNFYLKKIVPPFTASFIITSWIGIYLLLYLTDLKLPTAASTDDSIHLLSAGAKGFGQVMFQENIITGILFLLGILINSRIAAAYAVYATFLGLLIGWLYSWPISAINAGLMGYNGILCAVALVDTKRSSFFWISIAVFLSVILTIGLSEIEIIALTAPFVLSTWVVLKLKAYKLQSNRTNQIIGRK